RFGCAPRNRLAPSPSRMAGGGRQEPVDSARLRGPQYRRSSGPWRGRLPGRACGRAESRGPDRGPSSWGAGRGRHPPTPPGAGRLTRVAQIRCAAIVVLDDVEQLPRAASRVGGEPEIDARPARRAGEHAVLEADETSGDAEGRQSIKRRLRLAAVAAIDPTE